MQLHDKHATDQVETIRPIRSINTLVRNGRRDVVDAPFMGQAGLHQVQRCNW